MYADVLFRVILYICIENIFQHVDQDCNWTYMQMTTSRCYSPRKTCVLLHLGTQIGKPRKTLSSEAERNSEKKVHHARCSDSPSRGCTESKNICLWYEACTQMGHQAPCSARMNKNCKISLSSCFAISIVRSNRYREHPYLSGKTNLGKRKAKAESSALVLTYH